VVHADSIKPVLAVLSWFQCCELESYDESISNFAFKFNLRRYTKVAVALLHHGAQIDFTTIPRRNQGIGCTPLMYAMVRNHPGVVKLLLKRGADGTKGTAKAAPGIDAGSTALDIARSRTNDTGDCAETLAVLRLRCCSTCGMTSPGLSAATVGEKQHLKRCGDCHVRGSRTRYCSKECQRADWVPRHRRECAEARRARHAAGTEV